MSGRRSSIMYVTGLSGAGKSALLQAAAEAESVVDFSDLLKREIRKPISDWERLPDAFFDAAVERAANALLSSPPRIAAGHVFALRHGDRQIITGAWDRLLPCRAVVWLSVDPAVLVQRRPGQGRSVEDLVVDETFALDFLTWRSRQTHTPLLLLPNNVADDLESAASLVLRAEATLGNRA